MAGREFRVGVISDTHGLLRPELLPLIDGVDHILHAGDIGDVAILDALRTIAPVTAIRGNTDRSGECARLPETEMVILAGRTFYLIHDRHALDLKPEAAGVSVVVSGHTHQPLVERVGGVIYLNPGSCGPRRFQLPVTCAIVSMRVGPNDGLDADFGDRIGDKMDGEGREAIHVTIVPLDLP